MTPLSSFRTAALAFLCLASGLAHAEDHKLPFEGLHAKFVLFKAFTIDGESYVPCFVKPEDAAKQLDVAAANFRLVSPDGEEKKLKCELIEDSQPLKASAGAVSAVEDGFDHVLWLPKDAGKFTKGDMVESGEGRLTLSLGVFISSNSPEEEEQKLKEALEERKKKRAEAASAKDGTAPAADDKKRSQLSGFRSGTGKLDALNKHRLAGFLELRPHDIQQRTAHSKTLS